MCFVQILDTFVSNSLTLSGNRSLEKKKMFNVQCSMFNESLYLCTMKYGTVLVIDDNPAILTAVKICLGGTFERTLTLTSPDKALTTIAQEHPSVILLDMNFSLGVNSGQE